VERDAQWARVTTADFLTEAEKRRLLGLPVAAAAEARDGG
jgi:phage portal protein BeeE